MMFTSIMSWHEFAHKSERQPQCALPAGQSEVENSNVYNG